MSGSSSSLHFHNSFSFWWKRFRAIPTCKWFLYWISYISYYPHCSNIQEHRWQDSLILVTWRNSRTDRFSRVITSSTFLPILLWLSTQFRWLSNRNIGLIEKCMHASQWFAIFAIICGFPHMHCSAKHSISCIIATCNLLHPKSTCHLSRLSDEYISECCENSQKLGEAMPIRLEVLVRWMMFRQYQMRK